MESDRQRATEGEIEGVFLGDLRTTKERRAYLTMRLSELLTDFRKLEALDSPEVEPGMTPFPTAER
jgi:hypothetical protein